MPTRTAGHSGEAAGNDLRLCLTPHPPVSMTTAPARSPGARWAGSRADLETEGTPGGQGIVQKQSSGQGAPSGVG